MKKFVVLVAALLLFVTIAAESQQQVIVIEISADGEARVIQILSARSIISSISAPLISDRVSTIIATDERGILLQTTPSGDSLSIATLGATGINLSYKAEIISFNSGLRILGESPAKP